jgi:hypothetical protein
MIIGLTLLVALGQGPDARAEAVATAELRQPTVGLLDSAVVDDGVLARLVSARDGLLLVDWFEGGDQQRAEHLCGEALSRALPGIRSALREDRKSWRTAEPLSCTGLECSYNPGEIGRHDGRYLFRKVGGRLALYGIVRLESGAVSSATPARFAASALRRFRHARCPIGGARAR